jgi:hypothetical protein
MKQEEINLAINALSLCPQLMEKISTKEELLREIMDFVQMLSNQTIEQPSESSIQAADLGSKNETSSAEQPISTARNVPKQNNNQKPSAGAIVHAKRPSIWS